MNSTLVLQAELRDDISQNDAANIADTCVNVLTFTDGSIERATDVRAS